MKRYWLLFSQSVTVLLAVLFVVSTLKPQWLINAPRTSRDLALQQAPMTRPTQRPAGSLSAAARVASPAVVSINTSKKKTASPQGRPLVSILQWSER